MVTFSLFTPHFFPLTRGGRAADGQVYLVRGGEE
jgi:hypothetical protein